MGKLLNWMRHSGSLWGRALLGVLGGLLLALSFPAPNFAPGTFLGLFLTLLAIHNLGFFKALWIGLLAGFSFFATVLIWLTTYLGPVPWAVLAIAEGLIFGFGMAITALVWRWLSSLKAAWWKNPVIALSIGAIYTGREFFAGHYPFGGFPWARIGLSQVENPLAKWVWAIDISGLTWLIVAIVSMVTIRFLEPLPAGSGVLNLFKRWVPNLVIWILVIGIPLTVALPQAEKTGNLKVAAVQGNANAGLFARNPPGSILDKHLKVAKEIIQSGKAKNLDLMVFPENAADLDPVTMVEPNLKITEFVNEDLKAPLLFGNKTFRGADFYNEVDLWEPQRGLTDYYDKKRPVPFGEYVPNRSFFMALAPDMIGLIGWDMSPGTRDGVFDIGSKARVGSLICFEVTFDDLTYDLVDNGAAAIMVQTNSSDFGKSEQGVQLAAISRMRAIQTGRTVVSISTVGVSGIYAPDGTIISELPTFKPDYMVANIELRKDLTPAMVFGRYIEPIAFGLTLLLLISSIVWKILTRRKKRA
ncbi:MAG: apolipoprotein N-acyltransferase [Actinobacteria bacterium]|nr:apolipoprotein N-acyltransferase [Actinomycetota bacterium]